MKSLRTILDLFKKEKKPGYHDQPYHQESLVQDPDSGPPNSGPLDLDPKAQALRAFRTITLMLSLVQSRRKKTNIHYPKHALRKELKALDALATITIREHGIAAAVGRHNDASGTLEVLVSEASDSFSNPSMTIPQEAEPLTIATTVDPYTAVPNELQDSKETDLLETYLTHVWPKHDEIVDKSSYTHIWMINKLLGQIRMKSGSRSFLLYIIASCYLKVLVQMDYRTSKSIRNALKNVPTFEFSKKFHSAKPGEKGNDLSFLSTLLLYQPFLNCTTDIPNLTQKAKSLPNHYDFYTKETCIEFHLLLSELLESFHAALTQLNTLRKDNEHNVDKILDQLVLIARLGQFIRLMTKGTAIKKHLKVIDNFLPDRPPLVKQEDDDDEANDGEDGDDDGGGDDENIGLVGSQPGALHQGRPLPKWQIWGEWLDLLVIHFDSAHILNGFIGSSASNLIIDIKVLSEPLPDTNLLVWTDLLREICPSFFDVNELISFFNPGATKVDSEVVSKVVTKPLPSKEVCRLVKDLDKIPQLTENVEAFTNVVDHIISKLKTMSNYTSPVFIPTITKRLEDLWVLNNTIEGLTKIEAVLRTLRDNAKLFLALGKTEPLCTGTGFKAALHCEGSLAAHCFVDETWSLNFQGERPVGVSEQCCPICTYLLLLLGFTHTHSHDTITPCSLPESLPMEIIAAMISKFGGQLIDDLVDLKRRTDKLKSVDPSICSDYPHENMFESAEEIEFDFEHI